MRIRYLSDLHLEFIKPNKIDKFIRKITPNLNEICILAGDIGNPYSTNYDTFMKHVNGSFKRTFVIAGNHEYYGRNEIDETNKHMHDYFRQFENIRFLDNSFEIYDNYCFIGTTMWSKITNPSYEINDTINIPNFNYLRYNRLNMVAVDFLEDAIASNNNCIIITHHVPSNDLIDIKYKVEKMRPYNQWFYCDMDHVIRGEFGVQISPDKTIAGSCGIGGSGEIGGAHRAPRISLESNTKIKGWFYGHTHMPSFKFIHGIPFCCNPIGYPNENPRVDFEKYVIL